MVALNEGVVHLRDGRHLGYGEYGVRGGVPVLFFHGYPGGRALDLGDEVARAGAWLFVVERPGFGLSDSKPGRTLLDWPNDVRDFADATGLDQFAVAGISAGAPYALACGVALTARVTVVGLLSAWVPFDASVDPRFPDWWRDARDLWRTQPEQARSERWAKRRSHSARWAVDPMSLVQEAMGPAAARLPSYGIRLFEATFGGPADIDEDGVGYSPWGFAPEDVRLPVRAWHGGADDAAPVGAVEALVSRMPDAELTVYPGRGHLMFLETDHPREYLSVLTSLGIGGPQRPR